MHVHLLPKSPSFYDRKQTFSFWGPTHMPMLVPSVYTHTHTHPRNPRGSEKCTWKLLREEEKKRKKGKKKKEILFLLEGRRRRGGLLNWVTLWPPAYSSLLNQEIHWFTCVLFLPCVCVCERIPYYSPLPGIFLLFFFFSLSYFFVPRKRK